MSNTLILNDQNFQLEIQEYNIILVDFWAKWCGPCKMFTPVIDELSNELLDVKIAKCDIDDAPEMATKLSINSVPTVIVFKKGQEVTRFAGARSKAFIIDELSKIK